MATYVSTQSGDWDDPTTWGESVNYPSVAGDVVTVSAGHTVTYNVSSTEKMGVITINGTLTFATDMSTFLCWDLTGQMQISATGTLNVGTELAPIQAGNIAELHCDTTGMQCHWGYYYRNTPNEGIVVAAGGTINMYGDPAHYGSLAKTTIATDWTSGNTLYVNGDVTSWPEGLEIIVTQPRRVFYDDMGALASPIPIWADTKVFTIASIGTYENGVTPVTVTEDFPAPCRGHHWNYPPELMDGYQWYAEAGCPVMIMNRNVIFGKLDARTAFTPIQLPSEDDEYDGYGVAGYNTSWVKAAFMGGGEIPWGWYEQTNCAGIYAPGRAADATGLNFQDMMFLGGGIYKGNGKVLTRCIARCGSEFDGCLSNAMDEQTGTFTDNVFYMMSPVLYHGNMTFAGNTFCLNYTSIHHCNHGVSTDNEFWDCSMAFYSCNDWTITAEMYGVSQPYVGVSNATINGTVRLAYIAFQTGLFDVPEQTCTVNADVIGAIYGCMNCENTTFNGDFTLTNWWAETNYWRYNTWPTLQYAIGSTALSWSDNDCTWNGSMYINGYVVAHGADLVFNCPTIQCMSVVQHSGYSGGVNNFISNRGITFDGCVFTCLVGDGQPYDPNPDLGLWPFTLPSTTDDYGSVRVIFRDCTLTDHPGVVDPPGPTAPMRSAVYRVTWHSIVNAGVSNHHIAFVNCTIDGVPGINKTHKWGGDEYYEEATVAGETVTVVRFEPKPVSWNI